MKLLEQYLKAVGSRLSWRNRKDIIDELRSLMMDQIEETCGPDPDDETVKSFLVNYGSPTKTAAGYRTERPVIAAGLSDLFRLVLIAMAGAMAVAFVTVAVIEILQGRPEGAQLAGRILKVPLEAVSAWLAGVGIVTVIFMIMSRIMKDPKADLDEDWNVEDLKEVKLNETVESRLESCITIGFLGLLIVLLNIYPGIVALAENTFARTGLGPQHLLVIERFRFYVMILTVFWAFGIILRVLILRRGGKARGIELSEMGLSLAEATLSIIMLSDSSLFTAVGEGGWIGFKVIIAITLVVNIAEIAGGVFRSVRKRITGDA